ncbi:MAG: hypothetical protein II825_10310 [Paludibacteraceae bacterium]|nr:hypothetical protein [Paludibacteraceae bacterium]
MKKIALLLLAAVSLTGCWTRIYTVAPTVEPVAPVKTVYTTSVTTPTPKHTTVTTVTVTNYNNDWSFYLDLNAVAAAFAESRSVREFEEILNSSRYMINNLDLNRDGWIDYLRVIETYRGYYHTFLIQACLDYGVFQDVATLIAERRSNALYVEVVGDRYLYGYNYIVRPVFVKRPPLWDVFGRSAYAAWSSPYAYGAYPHYYTRPKPIYLNHYQAYVNTYMTNHHYCHHCDYPTVVFYTDYTSMTRSNSRNDYAMQHPNDSFEQRVTRSASSTNGVSVRNAGQLRTEVNKAAAKEETKTSSSSTTSSTRTSASTSTATTTKSATSTSGTSARSTGSSSSSSTSRTPASSTTAKTEKTTTATTSSRSTGTAASSATSTKSATTTSGTSARSTQTSTPQRQPSTTVQTRVNKSGTTRTTVRTTDANGRTTTVKRESSSRSSSGSTRSGTNTGGSSTRSR